MIQSLIVLFLLGALQGAVGWIMVASGLTGDAVYVKPTRLALHFVFAMFLLCYTFWFALQLSVRKEDRITAPRLRRFTWWIIGVLFIQLIFGALMAGHKAAPAAPTWPDINGSFIPAYVFNRPEGWRSIIEDRIVIHFIHRMLAYLLVVLILVWTLRAFRQKGSHLFPAARIAPLLFGLIQVVLGIYTALTSIHIRAARWNVFEWMAQLHQFTALLLLLSLVLVLFLLSKKKIKYAAPR